VTNGQKLASIVAPKCDWNDLSDAAKARYEEGAKAFEPKQQQDQPYVIVRTYSAGVHCGYLVSRSGKEVTLRENKRIWSWKGRYTLNEIANEGVGAGSNVSAASQGVVLEWIEILTCTELARENLRGAKWGQ
jgi:hypothetical protein